MRLSGGLPSSAFWGRQGQEELSTIGSLGEGSVGLFSLGHLGFLPISASF